MNHLGKPGCARRYTLPCRWLVLVFVWALFFSPRVAFGQRDSIAFAGIAYLANASELDSRFPIARALELLGQEQKRELKSVLFEVMRKRGMPVTVELKQQAGRAIAFAFDDEYQSVAQGPSGFKIVSVVSGQLLTVDFKEMTVLSAFPVTYEYVDVQAARPDASYARSVARAILPAFLSGESDGVFGSAMDIFLTLPAPGNAVCRVAVGGVDFDSSMTKVAGSRFEGDTIRLRRALNNIFSRTWATASRQPLLPNGRSQAVNGKMAARFSDGRTFDLKIPDPDYALTFTDIKVRQQILGGNSARRVDATGVQVRVGVAESLNGSEIAVGQYRGITQDTVPASLVVADAWPAVSNTIKSTIAQLGFAARQGDPKWFKENDISASSPTALAGWLKKCAP